MCSSLVSVFDLWPDCLQSDSTGKLGFHEFKYLWNNIKRWQVSSRLGDVYKKESTDVNAVKSNFASSLWCAFLCCLLSAGYLYVPWCRWFRCDLRSRAAESLQGCRLETLMCVCLNNQGRHSECEQCLQLSVCVCVQASLWTTSSSSWLSVAIAMSTATWTLTTSSAAWCDWTPCAVSLPFYLYF